MRVCAGSLFFLSHLRSCAGAAVGSRVSGSSGSGRLVPAGSPLLAPPWANGLLEVAFLVASTLVDRGCSLLVSVVSPGFWLPLAAALWVDFVSLGALPAHLALAVTSGLPVPLMAARAVLLSSGWCFWVGAVGLAAWGFSVHSPWGWGSCEAFSLLVCWSGLFGCGWSSCFVLGAAVHLPACP